ncbi:Hypothetical protein D9617_13g099060 [Elsinoe fawcettii]|nr:Hypothetical protein D9617_13g099060 [Elsinoe fawcettii]
MRLTSTSLLTLTLLPSALAVDKTSNPSLVASLKMAATANDRLALLPSTSDWTFDFTNQTNSHFSPGGVINANAATFPAVTGNAITMAMINLGPCSQLPPHFHARASNYVLSIHGDIQTYMIGENGSPTISTLLKPGQMTIFPQGAPHTMWNTGCENAQLVSALSNEDAGTMNLANALFQFGDEDEELVNAAVGYQNVVNGQSKGRVPASGSGALYGPKSCLERCKGANAGKTLDTWGMREGEFNYGAGEAVGKRDGFVRFGSGF